MISGLTGAIRKTMGERERERERERENFQQPFNILFV